MEKGLDWTKTARWVIVVGIVVGVTLPLVPILIWSFAGRWYFPSILPTEWSLRAWRYVFSASSMVPKGLKNSIIVACSVTLISIPVGILGGRAMGVLRFRGKELARLLILSPAIVPGLATSMGIHVVFIKYGLASTLWGVILVHLIPTTPYMVSIMSGVFSNYNPEFEEQARTLGAGPLRTFIHITLPAILPGVIVGSLFIFIISWNQYILTLLIGGGRVITLPMLVYIFVGGGDRAAAGALSLILIAPSLIFLVLSSKYLTGESAVLGGFGA